MTIKYINRSVIEKNKFDGVNEQVSQCNQIYQQMCDWIQKNWWGEWGSESGQSNISTDV